MKRTLLFGGVALVTVCAVGVALVLQRHHQKSGDNNSAVRPLVNQATLASLPHKSGSTADTSHLASGLLPPTNMWLSGMVLQKQPLAVYPMPLTFLAQHTGFEVGLPTVTATASQITGEHQAGVSVNLGTTDFKLKRYDKLSATLAYTHGSQTAGTLTLSEGSPFVFYTAQTASTITVSDVPSTAILEHSTHYVRYTRAGHTYVVSSGQGTISLATSGLSIQVHKNDVVSFYGLPSTTDTLRAYAGNAVTSVDVTHSLSGNTEQTKFHLVTKDGKPTAFATMPYTKADGSSATSYDSIYGKLPVHIGTSFTTSATAVKPSDKLDLSNITSTQRDQLVQQLRQDVTVTKINSQDSYYAGKQLARAANLLDIAQQLHQTALADSLTKTLRAAFAARLQPGYFYYDTKLHGVAATTAGFGSEDFNDHHFHYGYWLYAASIMASYDHSFVNQYGKQLNLLAADIANYPPGTSFPAERYYDPYAGHSWAAGLSPFSDGNNQESSSEAIHAWNGVSLWGKATGNTSLQQTGQWMLAYESQTAQKAWRSVDTSVKPLSGYTSPIASLNFGGKRTYSTFFSDAPSAKLGIQLIPMDPSMVTFASDANLQKTLAASLQQDNYNVPLGDYMLMYLSLSDKSKAVSLAAKQTTIDDGNSKTYLDAFILSRP